MRMRFAAIALISTTICRPSFGFERVVLTAGRITTPYASATGVRVALDLASRPDPTARLQ